MPSRVALFKGLILQGPPVHTNGIPFHPPSMALAAAGQQTAPVSKLYLSFRGVSWLAKLPVHWL